MDLGACSKSTRSPFMNQRQQLQSMRILITLPNYYGPPWSEGVANIARRLVKHLLDAGHEVTVICSGLEGTDPDRPGEFGELVHLVPPTKDRLTRFRFRFWRAFLRHVREVRDTFRPDVSLVFSSGSRAFSLRARLFQRLLGPRTAFYVSGLNRPLPGTRPVSRRFRVIVGSPFLHRWFPDAPVAHPVTPLHLKPDGTPPAVGRADGPFRVLFLGALQKERGVEYLIRGLAAAREMTDRQLQLTIAVNSRGESQSLAPVAEIERLISSLELDDIVELRGLCDTNELYRAADVVVIPRQEPTKMAFPVRILESVSFSTPLIVSTMCDMGQLVEDCGLVIDPAVPEDLARAIVKLAEDPVLYEKLSRGCTTALERYDPAVSLATIESVLMER